jgi:hypothetical protein
MSTSKKKPQVRPDQSVRKINKLAVGMMGISRKMSGLVPVMASTEMPAAASLPDGVLVFNSTSGKLQITVSGAFVNVA